MEEEEEVTEEEEEEEKKRERRGKRGYGRPICQTLFIGAPHCHR